MALSHSLSLRQSQSLVMTPQLMQSIQLLQMTFVELNQFIADEVEKNPLLELSTAEGTDNRTSTQDTFDNRPFSEAEADAPLLPSRAERLSDALDTGVENVFQDDAGPRKADAPELLSQWKSMPGSQGESGEGYDLDDFVAGTLSLREHIDQQIALSIGGDRQRLIARHLLDLVDDAGYMHEDIAEIAGRLGAEPAEIGDVLARMQEMDPPGIFARNLAECLSIQLRMRNRLDPAMAALLANLDLLARRDFQSLKKICGVDEEDLLDMLAEIKALDPKPGSRFGESNAESIIPDVIVMPSADGGWSVEVNPDTLPRVLINQRYYDKVMGSVARQSSDHAFLTECMQNANWLTRSLDQRARTILKVASEIVKQQDMFLAQGIQYLRPMNLKTVADAIKMHESTVSRVTSNKYMLTPRGLFELKYFFSVSIASAEGGDAHSAESVRHRIRTMIQEEKPSAVLSDDDIVLALHEEGIDIARRTVAKYREGMGIASSVQRRREKKAISKVQAA